MTRYRLARRHRRRERHRQETTRQNSMLTCFPFTHAISFCRHGPGERGSNYAHLESLALDAVRLVHEDIRTTTHSNPPRCLVKGYGLEFIGIVDVNRLKECLRSAEDYQRMAGDVRLLMTRAGQGQRIQAFSDVEKLQRNFKC